MGDILNDLTSRELLQIRERALLKLKPGACKMCETVVPMRKHQIFCSDLCRTRFANESRIVRIAQERADWARERKELCAEIAALKVQLDMLQQLV